MPTALTTHADLLAHAERAHSEHGIDFARTFDAYFSAGYVFKGPDFLIMFHDDREHDAWVIWWAQTVRPASPAEMLRRFLRLAPHYRPRIGWCRGLRPRPMFRFYSTERLLRFSGE